MLDFGSHICVYCILYHEIMLRIIIFVLCIFGWDLYKGIDILKHISPLLRFRTRALQGQLVLVSSQLGRDHLALQLMNGQLCVLLQFHPDPARSLCLTKAQVTDGHWHDVEATRYLGRSGQK